MPPPPMAFPSCTQQSTHPFTSGHEPAFLTALLLFGICPGWETKSPSLEGISLQSTPHFPFLDESSKANDGH